MYIIGMRDAMYRVYWKEGLGWTIDYQEATQYSYDKACDVQRRLGKQFSAREIYKLLISA